MAAPAAPPTRPPTPPDRAAVLAMLRARVARFEAAGGGESVVRHGGPAVSVAAGVDAALPGGGLARGAVHEVAAAASEDDSGPAFGFAALVCARAGGTTLWIEPKPSIWPEGAAAFGLDPAALVLVAADGADGLWAAEEALRCPAVGAVCLVAAAPIGLTAGRRLQLAAEAGGALGIALVPAHALARPSAAHTRWRISTLPGTGAAAPPPGLSEPRWRLELLRCRGGGRPGAWTVAWRGAAGRLEPDEGAGEKAAADRVTAIR
jgi:protein ImuA